MKTVIVETIDGKSKTIVSVSKVSMYDAYFIVHQKDLMYHYFYRNVISFTETN